MARKTSTKKCVGTRIRTLRKGRGWSLAELGELVGLTKQGVHRIEHGQVATDVEQVTLFARALGVSPSSLMPGE